MIDLDEEIGLTPRQTQTPLASVMGPNLDQELGLFAPSAPSIGHTGRYLASKLGEGMADTVAIPGDLSDLYTKYVGRPLYGALSGTSVNNDAPVPSMSRGNLPNNNTIARAGQQLGVWNTASLQPQNKLEQYGGSIMQGIGGAAIPGLGAAASAGEDVLKAALSSGISGGGAGAAGQAASDLYPKSWPGASVMPMLASLFGGKMTGSAGSLASSRWGTPNPTYQAALDLGLKPKTLGPLVDEPVVRRQQASSAMAPGGSQTYENWTHDINQFGQKVNSVADSYSSAATPQEAGLIAQDSAQIYKQQFLADSKKAWDAYYNAADPASQVPVGNYASALANITKTSPAVDPLVSTLGGQLKSGLEKETAAQPKSFLDIAGGLQSVSQPTLPLSTVRAIKTRLGQRIENPGLVADNTAQADVKQLWGSLLNDEKSHIAGTPAEPLFNIANGITQSGHQVLDSVVNPLLKDGAVPESVINGWYGGGALGGTKLQMVRDNMPDAADAMASTFLRRAAGGPGQSGGGTLGAPAPSKLGDYSPQNIFSSLQSLAPEAKTALFGPNLDIGNIQTYAGGQAKTLAIPSMGSTGQAAELPGTSIRDALLGGVGAGTATHELTGSPALGLGAAVPGAALGYLGPRIPGYVNSKLVASPTLTDMRARSPLASPGLQLGPYNLPFSLAPSLQWTDPNNNQ